MGTRQTIRNRALTAAAAAALGGVVAWAAAAAPATPPKPAAPAPAKASGAATPATPAPAAAAAPTPASPPGETISGVILGDGATTIAHAIVRVVPEDSAAPAKKKIKIETGADGAFKAQGLPVGNFTMRVDAKGFAPLNAPGIPAGAVLLLHLKRGVSLSGVVLDRATRKPLDGASVQAWEKEAELWGEETYRKGTSGKDGKFTIDDLQKGSVSVQAKAPGHAAGRISAAAGVAAADKAAASAPAAAAKATPPAAKPAAPPTPPPAIEILLDPAGTLSGLVTESSGAPVVGAEVTAYWHDSAGAKSRAAKSGPDGHYAIAAAGEVTIRKMSARAKGFLPNDRDGAAPSDGIVDFLMEKGGTITGQIKSSEGSVPTGVHVHARPDKDGQAADLDVTDPSGSFRVENVLPGTYTVEIAAAHFATVKKTEIVVLPERIVDLGSLTLTSNSTFRGRVVAARDQTPVPGVPVRVSFVNDGTGTAPGAGSGMGSGGVLAQNLWTVNSGTDGTFVLNGLGKGSYDVSIEQTSFSPARQRVTFDPEGDTPEVVIQLFRGGSLAGVVSDSSMNPVAGVHIMASMGADSDARVADTGSDGHYFIDGLTPGMYQVSRQSRDGGPPTAGANSKTAQVREGETTTVDFDEEPKIILSGTVRKGGQPLQSAPIYLFPVDGPPPHPVKKTQTDGDGNYQVGLDSAGRYQASVRLATTGGPFGQNVVTLSIPDQPQVHQDITFASNAISGKVTSADGKPIKGAIILAIQNVSAPGVAPKQATSVTQADGTYRLDGVDTGTYRVTAKAPTYAPAEQYPVEVTDDQAEVEVDLTMDKGWILTGHVSDPNGQPVTDATVIVAADGTAESGFLPTQTDRAGTYRITAPTDGSISVAAISPRFAPAVQTNIQPPGGDQAPPVDLHATVGGSLRIEVVHRGGGAPVAGAQASYRPLTLFPGSDLVIERNLPRPTDATGMAVVSHLYPGSYVVVLVGRNDVQPMSVNVGEGSESPVVFEVP